MARVELARQCRDSSALPEPALDCSALIFREAQGPAECLAFTLCSAEASLCTLDQQVSLELRDGVDDVHGQLAGRTGQINAAQGEAMNTHPKFGQLRHGAAHVHHIAAKAIELVTTSTSPASRRSRSRVNPRRCAVATFPETVSVTTRRGSTLKPAALISCS